MSVNEKMTAIANEVRELAGIEDALGLDAMATNVGEANDEISLQEELLEQAIAELKGKADPDLYNNGYANGYTETLDKIISGAISGEITTDVATVRDGAFWHCPITKADLPNATSIGRDAFRETKIVSITAPNAKSIGSYGLQACNQLKRIDLLSVKNLGGYTLQSCSRLTDVNMPSLTSLTTADMYGCSSLARLDLPSLTSIGHSVFNSSSKLATIILRNKAAVCTLAGTGSFTNTPIANGTGYIYVPDDLVEQYKSATNWSTFADQIKPLSELEV